VRGAFIRTLARLAENDERIVLLTGDLGYMALEPFANRFPTRFFNVGVAEQNMIGLATGLAEGGFVPFVYSIATFATLRGYEFIRHGPVLQRLPVRVVGVGGGFEYAHNGASHHALEDLAVMRTQPGMTVIAPADAEQAERALVDTWQLPGPIYYRLGKNDAARVPGLNGDFEFGGLAVLGRGEDIAILTVGGIAGEAVIAAEMLRERGLRVTVAVVSTISPPPTQDLKMVLEGVPLAITVEAHYASGGLGSLVAEVVAECGLPCRLVRCAVNTTSEGVSGSEEFLHRLHGLSADCLFQRALAAVAPKMPENGAELLEGTGYHDTTRRRQ
jgi:transketolase